ncbi:aldehyde oxidoreductase molybdenum-binding subunit PaoC, partial [Aureimonas sp. Leaf460]|uniref:aldehyde oxidoreductase molybdenum-binding subunit PaoC n=2 Tax=unclassified Aureimonas TaxID=2615206 RepID=UPI001FCCF9B6
MKFDTAATTNPIDQMKVVGKPHERIDGRHKVTGTAPYAYERHDVVPDAAYGYVVGSAIAKGRIAALHLDDAKRAPGVIAIVTAESAGELGKGKFNVAKLLGGPAVDHYHQAIALVVARSFEEARDAASLMRIDYISEDGRFALEALAKDAPLVPGNSDEGSATPGEERIGNFEQAFTEAEVKLDEQYTTPDQSHSAMEPHASTARWDGDELTVWTSNQMIDWGLTDLAATLNVPKEKVRLISPFIGGGFGGKLFLRTDAVLAALGAKAAGRPVKVTLTRPLIANNTTHRPATIQRVRIGAGRDGRIAAIAHESTSGNLKGGDPETAVAQTKLLYAGAHRLASLRMAEMDLPEGNAMRAPGEAPGLMALEIAMDEMAEKLELDPIEFRAINDTQVDPMKPERPFSQRQLVECLRQGAERFGWNARNPRPGQVRDGQWLVGIGVASAFRNNLTLPSGARVRLGQDGVVTVETDMTDIGTGSYTIIAQTAAEMMGLPLSRVAVNLGDSSFPVSAGSGGQFGANSATAGVYAACVKLREAIAAKLGFNSADDLTFADGEVRAGNRSVQLADAASDGEIVAEDKIEFDQTFSDAEQQSTFGAHFVEVGVDVATAEVRVRRMLSVCAAGRILNPMTARSQVIGAMTMGVGGALMEELAVDTRYGFFVNHDLAGYEVPVHADIPHQEVIFLDETDPRSSPMKAKGIG